ncbi:hypothetical protein HPB50_022059 [Hyalomma asiaticum]|uniref:Uncharacterized protein n=1 Tax=Hyalomma asiaticum TaxID=266040 RepID=A0ACB7S7B7_HYAAI|nr:hypothetical protein HPB50_022059 [Hyalomma asiaticum]
MSVRGEAAEFHCVIRDETCSANLQNQSETRPELRCRKLVYPYKRRYLTRKDACVLVCHRTPRVDAAFHGVPVRKVRARLLFLLATTANDFYCAPRDTACG